MKANGHSSGPIRFGDTFGHEPEPPTTYTIVEVERAPSAAFAEGLYDLEQEGRAILRGDGVAVTDELAKRRAYTPIPLVAMQLTDGRRLVYRHRGTAEALAGTSPVVWRSDRQRQVA